MYCFFSLSDLPLDAFILKNQIVLYDHELQIAINDDNAEENWQNGTDQREREKNQASPFVSHKRRKLKLHRKLMKIDDDAR